MKLLQGYPRGEKGRGFPGSSVLCWPWPSLPFLHGQNFRNSENTNILKNVCVPVCPCDAMLWCQKILFMEYLELSVEKCLWAHADTTHTHSLHIHPSTPADTPTPTPTLVCSHSCTSTSIYAHHTHPVMLADTQLRKRQASFCDPGQVPQPLSASVSSPRWRQ